MINERLKALQDKMINSGIDLYYFNTSDYHMSEYVSAYFKTIEYFSGFTGSLATLLVSKNEAFIFVDGRYYGQADKQCGEQGVKVIKLGTKNALKPLDFILKFFKDSVIGLDGKRASIKFVNELVENKINVRSIDIYSSIIEGRPLLRNDNIFELGIKYVGLDRQSKLKVIKHCLNGKCHIESSLECIAYILNLRSTDIKHTPVFYSYLVFLDNDVYLFCEVKRIKKEILDSLYADGVIIRPYDSYYEFLDIIKNQTIMLDEDKTNYETYLHLNNKNNKIYHSRSLIEDMKSIKNNVEQKNSEMAHIYDGVVMVRFLMWLDSVDKTNLDEYVVSEKLNELRLSYKAFDLSFESIVAYNKNAALMHYQPKDNDCAKLDNRGILLIDSGGQYFEGTTDVTRTVALGAVNAEIRKYFTLVLKSMFNLSELKFMKGLSGNQIDIIARKDLWAEGIDYRCGTGHGVGHVLSVHEGPPNVRYMKTDNHNEEVAIKPGMIFSDEPGVYFEGKYGIRCENLLLCKKDRENEFGEFLKFETLTLVPFDLKLIDKSYLDEVTINALNNYHQRVYEKLSPHLDEDEREYLRRITIKI